MNLFKFSTGFSCWMPAYLFYSFSTGSKDLFNKKKKKNKNNVKREK